MDPQDTWASGREPEQSVAVHVPMLLDSSHCRWQGLVGRHEIEIAAAVAVAAAAVAAVAAELLLLCMFVCMYMCACM